jgi:predicted  nucleic acid-binding Zn-ribbon protein
MTDLTAPPPDAVVTHSSLEQVLRSVLSDVVSEGTLIKMVNVAVENRTENMRSLISGIDQTQRNSFQDFKDASREFKSTADGLRQTMTDISARVVRAETSQEADSRRISDVYRRVDVHDQQLDQLRDQMTRIENAQVELRIDIHGDDKQALRPSIHSLLREMDSKLDQKFAGIETDIRVIKDTQERHEAWITRRKAIETWAFKILNNLWERQLTRWALITGLPVMGGLFVAAADPRIANGIGKFISLLLNGK